MPTSTIRRTCWLLAGALDACEQFLPFRSSATAVVAHAGDDVGWYRIWFTFTATVTTSISVFMEATLA